MGLGSLNRPGQDYSSTVRRVETMVEMQTTSAAIFPYNSGMEDSANYPGGAEESI